MKMYPQQFFLLCNLIFAFIIIKCKPIYYNIDNTNLLPVHSIFLAIISDKKTINRAIEFDDFYKFNHNSIVIDGPHYYFIKDGYENEYKIFNETKTYPKQPRTTKSFLDNLLEKTICIIEDFLFNSTAEWIFRPTDDVYLSPINFPDKINEQLSKYDPKHEFLILGDCQKNSKGMPSIHGGSGVIISRYAAEVIYKTRNDLLRMGYNEWEDEIFPQYAMKATKKFVCSLDNIAGHSFPKEQLEFLQNKSSNKLPKCNLLSNDTGWTPKIQPLNDLAIFHQYWSRSKSMLKEMHQVVTYSSPRVMWYHTGNEITLCTK